MCVCLHKKLIIVFSIIIKNSVRILMEITLNLYIYFGSMAIIHNNNPINPWKCEIYILVYFLISFTFFNMLKVYIMQVFTC